MHTPSAKLSVIAMPGAGGTIVWFRQDLRLADNPALDAAVARGEPVIPVYIRCEAEEGDWPAGGAARWWLHHSLAALDGELRERGSRLTLLRGPALDALRRLIAQTGATAVHWNRRYEPAAIACERDIRETLRARGVAADSFNGALLAEPWDVHNQAGRPYRVYSAFRRRVLERLDPAKPLPPPRRLAPPRGSPESLPLDAFELLPGIDWYRTLAEAWRPGAAGAHARLRRFVEESLEHYHQLRDRPATAGTSALSPHLHFGEISVRELCHTLDVAIPPARKSGVDWRDSAYVSELIWREFAHHLLYHFPQTPTAPFDPRFARFSWRADDQLLRAWQRGRTGFPIVDAGMRQLWATGWMHNRVRMIVASLLVKNLRIHWLEGARWFWDTLVDADLAANTLNWQWVAGSGADAAPYFRVFNPVAQGERFDPDGDYVRRWVSELGLLRREHIHAPWLAPAAALAAARVRIGSDYPAPIVDLKRSRDEALAAYQAIRRARRARADGKPG